MKNKQKTRTGVVLSRKMDKTAIVSVVRLTHHPLYNKVIKKAKKYKVHDENNACHPGDKVRIIECRPLSREKRWRLAEILLKGEVAEIQPQEIDVNLARPEAKVEAKEEATKVEAKAEAEGEATSKEQGGAK